MRHTFAGVSLNRAVTLATLVVLFVTVLSTVDRNAAAASPINTAKRCKSGFVHGVVRGRHVCLRAGRHCSTARDASYHRFGFHCHFGVLEAFVWAPLRRPLRLPVVASGESCPASTARQVHTSWGAALGDGPVYPVPGIAPGRAHVRLASLALRPGGYYVKTIWIGNPASYSGPFLVRGRRLDAPGVVAFSDRETDPPLGEAQMSVPDAREWREATGPVYTRLPSQGCYGLQVDGRTFSFVVTFEVS